VAEPFTLLGILCHEYNLINDLLKRVNEPLNKGLRVPKKVPS
jgi:hypothetical protein